MSVFYKRFEEQLLAKPRRKDPYRSKTKPAGRPVCPSCGAVSLRGRWTPLRIIKGKAKNNGKLCPACRQERDHYAGAVVVLEGEHWRREREAVLGTLKNAEKILRARNDQERILWTDERRGALRVYVTLPELARQMGRILERSFKGKVSYRRSSEEPFIHVIWSSDAESVPKKKAPHRMRSGHGRARGFRRRSA
jgi:hypothetical protein